MRLQDIQAFCAVKLLKTFKTSETMMILKDTFDIKIVHTISGSHI